VAILKAHDIQAGQLLGFPAADKQKAKQASTTNGRLQGAEQ